MLECGEEKVLTLTEVERIKALAAQLVKLLRAQKSSSLPVSQLLTEYSKTFGYGLRLQDYDASSLPALLCKLCHVVKVKKTRWRLCSWFVVSLFSPVAPKVVNRVSLFLSKVLDGPEGRELQLINRKSLRLLISQMLDLLMSQEDGQVASGLRVDLLSERYLSVHGAPLNPCEYGFLSLGELLKSLPYLVEVRGRRPSAQKRPAPRGPG